MNDHPITTSVLDPNSDPDFEDIPFPHPDSPTFARELSAYVRKILLRSPLFPRFYTDVVLRSAPNSNAAKILRPHYTKILEKVNMAIDQQKSSRTCTHIKVGGARCQSPSLRGEQFCYFHQRMHRGVRTPPDARLHPVALIEDETSIQAALMEVINALMRNTIDLKRAGLILRALHIAVKNVHRVRFDVQGMNGVRDIPEYNEPESAEPAAAAGSAKTAASTKTKVGPAAAATPPFDELSLYEPSAPPESQRPKYRPDPGAGKSYEERLADYFGKTKPPQAHVLADGTAATRPLATPQPPRPEAPPRKPDAATLTKKPSLPVKEAASAKAAASKERKPLAHSATAG